MAAHDSGRILRLTGNPHFVQLGNWGWRVGESGVFDGLKKEAAFLRKTLAYYNRAPDIKEAVEEIKSDKSKFLQDKDGILEVAA
jgi:hypothetical protein